jgi:hypothetical protein
MQSMSSNREYDKPMVYQIRVKGILDARWSEWLGGLTIAPQANGETLLTGAVADQAALHGVLARIRDMNLLLLSVERMKLGQ